MKTKNQKGSRRPSLRRQTTKALGGHTRARHRKAVRKFIAI